MTSVTADNISHHELIGLNARISGTTNKSQRKIKGLIISETRNTLSIYHHKREKTVAKSETSFSFNLDETWVEVEGKTLIGRPEDRVKKSKEKISRAKTF